MEHLKWPSFDESSSASSLRANNACFFIEYSRYMENYILDNYSIILFFLLPMLFMGFVG